MSFVARRGLSGILAFINFVDQSGSTFVATASLPLSFLADIMCTLVHQIFQTLRGYISSRGFL
jgi:hypothetical protein